MNVIKRQYRSLDYVFMEVVIARDSNQRVHVKRVNSIWNVTVIS